MLLTIAYNENSVVQGLGVAQELPGVADSAVVELHRVGVDPDGDGAVLDQPLGKKGLILGKGHPT